MPGARTYQAIGFATYQGGRVLGKHKRAELERQVLRKRRERQGVAAAAAAVAVIGLVAVAARRASRMPTI